MMKKTVNKRCRMIDIAHLAKVSRTAVTHVLTGAGEGKIGGVSQAKAEEIRRIAAQLGYVPNLAAQQLAGKKSGIVGAIASQWWSTETRFFSILQKACATRGLDILAVQADNNLETVEQFVESWLGRGVEALIVLAFYNDMLWTQSADILAPFPHVISVVIDPEIPGSYAVKSDVAGGMRQAIEHLHRQGRKKIVLLLEDLDRKLNRLRKEAFFEILNDLGCPAEPNQLCIATKGWSAEDYPNFLALADELRSRGADAILADTDYSAAFLSKAFLDRGLCIPDDMAVVGWGNEILSQWSNPLLTTVSYEFEEIVKSCLEMLSGWMGNSGDGQIHSITVPMKLFLRESA
jgi:DNA-binding LacI/PurR family transcriptional regulator